MIGSLQGENDPYTITYESVTISTSVDTAIPIGLIANELLTNAIKYAFPNNKTGKITVSLMKKDTYCTIHITDNGIGLPKHFDTSKSNSMGIHLVKSLIMQIDGTFSITSKNGTHCEISFPF